MLTAGNTSYIYGPDGLPVESVAADGTPTYLFHDQIGSTRLLTNPTGTVTGTYTYDAWGNTTSHTGTATTPLQYTAQFLTIDPLLGQTRATYTYAGNNPITGTDPTGLGNQLVGQHSCGGPDEPPCNTRSNGGSTGSGTRCSHNIFGCGSLDTQLNENGPQGAGNGWKWNMSSGACFVSLGFLATCGNFATTGDGQSGRASGGGPVSSLSDLLARLGAAGSDDASSQLAGAVRDLLAKRAGFSGTGSRLIVDENLPSAWASGLRDAGYDARSVAEMGLRGASDQQLNQLADQLGARVLTRDVGHDLFGGFGSNSIILDSRIRSLETVLRLMGGQ